MLPDQDHIDGELAALDQRLRELESEPDDDGLYPESFMQEHTAFKSWDEFKVRLAATPRPEREAFMRAVTSFSSYEEMERLALERLAARTTE